MSAREPRASSYLHWTLDPSVCCKANGSKQTAVIQPPAKPSEHAWRGDQCVFKRMNLQRNTNSFLPTCEQKAGHKREEPDFNTFYLSLLFPLELLPVDPARVRLPLESPESFRVRLPTCSFELALLIELWWEGRWHERGKKQVIKLPHSKCPLVGGALLIPWFSSDLPHNFYNVIYYNRDLLFHNSLLHYGEHNYSITTTTCANLHFSAADSLPIPNNKKAPSAVHWPVGLVT